MATSFDPRRPDQHADPHPTYRQLRRQGPVSPAGPAGMWVVSRYAACVEVLRGGSYSAAQGQRLRLRGSALPRTMLSTDPPEHTRLRGALAPAFGSGALAADAEGRAGLVRGVLAAVGSRLADGEKVDVATDAAGPISVGIMARLLGVTPERLADFTQWCRGVAAHFDPFATDADLLAAEPPMRSLLEWAADELYAGRHADDTLGVIRAAHRTGTLDPGEALATVALVVVGGVDPLAALVCDLVVALGSPPAGPSGPGQPADPAWVRSLVEEVLRLSSPISFTARTALHDTEIAGCPIPGGDRVVVLLGSANRDERQFTEPDRLTPTRIGPPQLAFGAGPHTCLGAPVVRAVARQVVGELLTWPPWRVDSSRAAPAIVPRGYDSLIIERYRARP